MDHYEVIARAYDELIAEGKIFPVYSNEQVVEEQKALLTRRSAYYLNQLDSRWGLLAKTSGNNVQGLSVDVVVDKIEGGWADIATDRDIGGDYRKVFPVNSSIAYDTALISKWVLPLYEWCAFEEHGDHSDAPHTDTPHTDTPPDDSLDEQILAVCGQILQEVMNLETQIVMVTNQIAALDAKVSAIKGCIFRR